MLILFVFVTPITVPIVGDTRTIISLLKIYRHKT